MKNCQPHQVMLAETDVTGLNPYRVGSQGMDFFRTSLKEMDFSDCVLEGITVSGGLGELRSMKVDPA